MKDLFMVLRRRILVVYHDIEWRDEMFDKMLNAYPEAMVCRKIKSMCGCSIELIDGTILKFVYAGDNSRGVRADKIIAQPGIEQEVLTTIFGRALVHATSMYVATDDGIMPAITYYADIKK